MKVIVNKDVCIGCGACPSICPEIFDLNDEGYAYVRDEQKPVENNLLDDVKTALESCPTGAIEEVEKIKND